MAQTTDLALLERFSAQMMATARRYSDTPDDAEDAYQRAAEILLKRRSEPPGEDMCRWLRTTVKHEALAIRRSRERMVPLGGADRVPEPPGAQPDTEERAERFERLRLGAQALRSLKPQEIRCLALRAEGYTYNEICQLTGFSYTKVDRCLKEGRAAFAARVARIESGDECRRIAPVLSALADGEASSEDLAAARPHLRACLPCRAKLREYRAVPSRVGALMPPVALAGGGGAGPLRSLAESVAAAVQDRVAALGDRAHQAAELASGQKAAAVAASAAALAGGSAARVEHLDESAAKAPSPAARTVPQKPAPEPAPPDVTPTPPPAPTPASPPAPAPAPAPRAPAPRPEPPNEFAPDAAASSAAPRRPPAGGEFAPGGGSSSGGEFGP